MGPSMDKRAFPQACVTYDTVIRSYPKVGDIYLVREPFSVYADKHILILDEEYDDADGTEYVILVLETGRTDRFPRKEFTELWKLVA